VDEDAEADDDTDGAGDAEREWRRADEAVATDSFKVSLRRSQ